MYNLRSAKRLHMRVYYSLFDNSVCYLTFRTVSFTSTEEDRGMCYCSDTCYYIILCNRLFLTKSQKKLCTVLYCHSDTLHMIHCNVL